MALAHQSVEESIRRMRPVTAPAAEKADVAALHQLLQLLDHARRRRAPECQLVGPKGESIAIPESVFYALERVAEVLARGDAITIIPVGKELTTQQAADLLNVSRQYLVRLLEENKLPHSKTGKHRRLRIEDVIAFKAERDHARKVGLAELTEMSEAVGGYSELK